MTAYPDLGAPPAGWTFGRQGKAIRLVPPGALLDQSPAAIIVSPLLARSAQLPEPVAMVAAALGAETSRTGARLVAQDPVAPARAASGLDGVRISLSLRRTDGQVERRVYVLYRDERWLYGISLIADDGVFGTWLPTFDAAAASVLPYTG